MNRMALAASVAVLLAVTGIAGYVVGHWRPSAAADSFAATASRDRDELQAMYEQDQADRSGRLRHTDWAAVGRRDRARRERVATLVREGILTTANDYYRAAMILQHGDRPDDFILAHELAVVAAINGNANAKWLAAATEDRLLRSMGRPQRFGTQFRQDGDGPWYLESVDPVVPDALRRAMDVPAIAEAAARVADLNKSK